MSMKAYIYGRYSSHNQKDTSIEQQFREIYDYCERNEIRILGEYADRAVSGKTDKRPEFQRMMRDCAKERVQLIVCWKVDRFARNRYDAAMYKARLKRHGIRVVYAKESIPDGPEGILLESILEGSAEYYSANLSQNIRRGMRENALECKVNSGNLALGYRKGPDGRFAIEPIGATIVRDVFDMYTSGTNIVDICADLNSKGCRTSRGARFNKNSLRVMLRNERYIGVYQYGDIRIENGIPPIITKEVFELAQKQIKKNAKAPASAWSQCDYLLTGKLFCGLCGSAMIGESGTSQNAGKIHNYYICGSKKRKKGCKKKTVRKAWVEGLITQETSRRVLVRSVINNIADAVVELQKQDREDSEVPILQAQLSEVKKGLGNIMKAIEQGILTPTTKQRMEELEQQRVELEDAVEIASLSIPEITKEQVIFWMENLKNQPEPELQKQIIETFVNAVYLYDDHVKIVYNYTKNGSGTVDFKFIKETEESTNPEKFGLVHDGTGDRT